MSTAQALIKQSLRKVGAIGEGDVPSGDQDADALVELNQLLADLLDLNVPIINKMIQEQTQPSSTIKTNDYSNELFIPQQALNIQLNNFDGPLDLLVHLVKKQKLYQVLEKYPTTVEYCLC